MAILDRKLFRDLARMWAQVLAIALVMACGVATIVIAIGGYYSLEETRAAFYDRYRFANVFASLTRAPLELREPIAAIAGVTGVELRIVRPILLDIPGMVEPASGIAVSIPDVDEPAVNRLYIRSGRLPAPNRIGEVAVLERFATAHRLALGGTFQAVMNGKLQRLTITAIVLSPEFIYAIGPGDMIPDDRRFGVFFLPRSVMAGLFDMDGAFNDVVLRTQRGADIPAVSGSIDTVLKPYGGTGAHGRPDQISHAFLDNELVQLRAMAAVIPPIFLFVSAFLVNMVLSRLISLEREQIGLLKAVGYAPSSIAWHYAKFTLVIAIIGVLIGAAAGNRLGRGLTGLYADFYSFPFLIFRQNFDIYGVSACITAFAALAGAARAIWEIVKLPAAVAMQPPAPTRYRTFHARGSRHVQIFSQLTIMALRHLLRWPIRALLTAVGTSLSVALLVTTLFSFDSVDFMVDVLFFRTDRQDVTLSFAQELSPRASQAVAKMPGVLRVEPFRTTPVLLRRGYRERRIVITGLPRRTDLTRILDDNLDPIEPPETGLLVSERVAWLLHLKVGDMVEIVLLERDRRTVEVPVTSIIQSYIGLAVYMQADALDRLIADGPRVSGARISIDTDRLDDFNAIIRHTPAVNGIARQDLSRIRFRETVEHNITIMTTVYTALAVIVTFGVIYNSARIQLSERARELACLRVLGFTRAEVSNVLLLELGIITAVAQPLGWLFGYLFSWWVMKGFDSDLFRVPFVINQSTFAVASLIVLTAAVLSALVVRRRVDRLDLVRVLKTRE